MATVSSNPIYDQMLSCPVCTEFYQEPKQLPCQHSFCKSCLTTYLQSDILTRDGIQGFRCPICRQFVKGSSAKNAPNWADDFPTNQVLVDLIEISTLKADTGSKSLTCDVHSGRTCEYFCSDHGVVVCSSCAIESHRRCEQVISCIDAVGERGKDIDLLTGQLNYQVEKVLELQEDRKARLSSFVMSKDAVKLEIQSVQKEITKKLDDLEGHLLKELDTAYERETQHFQREIETLQTINDNSQKMKSSVSSCQEEENKWRILFSLEKMQRSVAAQSRVLSDFESNLTDVNLAFRLEDSWQHINTLGMISCPRRPLKIDSVSDGVFNDTGISSLELSASNDDIDDNTDADTSWYGQVTSKVTHFMQSKQVTIPRASGHKSFNAKTATDEADCLISGAAFLPEGQVLLVDNSNKKLKLFNKKYELVEEIEIDSTPWGITRSGKEVLVSLPKIPAIRTYNIENGIRFIKTTRSSIPWFGIDQKQEVIVTSSVSTGDACLRIQTIGDDIPPLIIRPTDKHGKSLLHKLHYVTMSHDASRIYVTDKYWNHSVKCLTPEGEIEWERKLMGFYKVNGIAILKDTIFVATQTSVEMMDITGQLLGPLLTEERGNVRCVQTICTDNECRLLVTEGHHKGSPRDNIVKIFYMENASKRPYLFSF